MGPDRGQEGGGTVYPGAKSGRTRTTEFRMMGGRAKASQRRHHGLSLGGGLSGYYPGNHPPSGTFTNFLTWVGRETGTKPLTKPPSPNLR